MKVHCSLRFTYESKEQAEEVLSSLLADNEGFVKARLEGSSLISEASAESIPSLLHTLNDYLSCLAVAEKIIEKKHSSYTP
ncbi:MAG: KEOPS complex subunit Pcc1 [Thermoplasmata archaeon]